MNFLDFVNNKNTVKQQLTVFNEAFKNSAAPKALNLMYSLFKKKIDGLTIMVKQPTKTRIGSDDCLSYTFLNVENSGKFKAVFTIDYLVQDKSTSVYSVNFFSNPEAFWGNDKNIVKSDLTIYTMGTSIALIMPVIFHVMNTHNWSLSLPDAKKLAHTALNSKNESLEFWIGAAKYNVFNNLSNELIKETFLLEKNSSEAEEYRDKVYYQRREAKRHKNESPEANELYKKIADEYKEIVKAIQGGATTIGELKMAIKNGIKVQTEIDPSIIEAEKKLEEKHEDPEVVFKKMQNYVNMVLKGLTPSVILCGAPGVGKTFRIMQQLKAKGYKNVDDVSESDQERIISGGKIYHKIKGKCTPRNLYKDLYYMQKKGDIMVIDDADCLIGPKAPEDVINILKAALDSTADDDGRLVSYGVSGKILDDEGNELPKRFYYNGGVIVITNYTAGQLDSALRGRSYIQDIHFTTEDILQIVEGLLPKIDPQKLSMEAKEKAFKYFKQLAEEKFPMQVSIRTFGICAVLYENAADDPDVDDKTVEGMIREQMKLQAAQGGKKY